jgi:hypothetical protein
MSNPKAEACSHCENYHASNGTKLCNNCQLLSPEKREAQSKFKKQMAENKRKADEEAKKAYRDSLRELNAAAAAAVTGQDDTSSDKSESRRLSLGN